MSASQAQSAWPLQKPQQLVYIELGPDNGGMMLGICEQGLSFRAVSPLRAEGPVHFSLALDGKTRLQGVGEIVWSEENGRTGGLKFTNVSAQFRESLRAWLSSEAAPKNVGREVTPVASPPLDIISKRKPGIRSAPVEKAKPTDPPQPAETTPFKAEPTEQVQPNPVAREVETQVFEPAPAKIEQKSVEAKPEPVAIVEPERSGPIASEPELRTVAQLLSPQPQAESETQVTEPAQIERKSVEAKPEPVVIVEPERSGPAAPEPELRTVAPLPSPQPQAEPTFSLPNFRLPSPPLTPAQTEVTVAISARISPAVSSIVVSIPPKISLAEMSAPKARVVSHQTEKPASPRETELPDFFAEDFAQESPRLNRAVAAGIIGLALAVILAALVLSFRRDFGAALTRLGEKLAGEERKPAMSQPFVTTAPAQNSQSSTVPVEKSAGKTAPSPNVPAISQPQSSATVAQPSVADSTIGNALSSNPVSPSGVQGSQDLPLPTDGGSGQKEFEQARAILKGNHRQRDISFAVDLLWICVGKGYVPAEVTLADLYARGDGVEKSCVQARTLLEAAVRKGSPEGRLRLDQIKRRSCR